MNSETKQANNNQSSPAPVEQVRSLLFQMKTIEEDRRDSHNRILSTEGNQRSSLLRDVLNISVTLLIGSMTLYTVAPHLVKTPVLFFISLGFLLLSTVINVLGRIQILNYASSAVQAIENYYAGAVAVQTSVQANNTEDSRTRLAVYNEQGGPRIPSMKWIGRISHLYSSAFLLIGLLGVGASLLVHITV